MNPFICNRFYFPLRALVYIFFYFISIKKHRMVFYNVGYIPGPIGKPIIYQPTVIAIHTTAMIKKYGVIICSPFLIVIGLSLCKLYKFKYPIYIMNEAINGVYPFVIESPTLITICANSGDKFDCIKIGTTTGENNNHLLVVLGNIKPEIAIKMIVRIINNIPLISI